MLEHALDYARRGWPVLPCNPSSQKGAGKKPSLAADLDHLGKPVRGTGGLYKATSDPEIICAWWKRWPDALIGIRTGAASGVFAIDPDVAKKTGDPDGMAAWEALVASQGGIPQTYWHATPSGGKHVLFRWYSDRPLTNSTGSLPPGVDVRGEGGYIIVPPSVLADGRCYRADHELSYEKVAEAPEWLLRLIETRPQREPLKGLSTSSPQPMLECRGSSYLKTAVCSEVAAVACAPQGQRNVQLNRSAFNLGTLIGAGELDRTQVEQELFAAARHLSATDGEDATIASISSGLEAGMQRPRRALTPLRRDPQWSSDARDDLRQKPCQAETASIAATPFQWIDPSKIPRRQWIYGRHYIRKFIGGTISPGALGKSSLVIVEALAIATGRALLGKMPEETTAVWYWNGEDPKEELQRRIMAAITHYGIEPAELGGRLFVDTGRETKIVIAEQQSRTGTVIARPVVDQVIDTIRKNNIGVFIVDPFVASHRVAENDNPAIELVASTWAEIADRTGCAIELVHHSRKTGGNDVTVEDSRGGSALLAKVRSARTLNAMSEKEAAELGVNRKQYFRVENGKANLIVAPDKADWCFMQSIDLGNGLADAASDSVGVVTPWQWPDLTSGVTVSDLRAAQNEVAKGRWRADVQARDWVGVAIAKAMNLDVTRDADKAKIKALLKTWTSNGMFVVVDGQTDKRETKKFVEVGDWASD